VSEAKVSELFLKFRIGEEAFALRAREVRTILPSVPLRPLDNSPDFVAGLLDYQGTVVPVLDLCQMCAGRPAVARYSTRIMLVDYPLDEKVALLGMLAEQVTDLIECDPEQFLPLQVSLPEACLSGEVARLGSELVARVRPDQLLSPERRQQLFA